MFQPGRLGRSGAAKLAANRFRFSHLGTDTKSRSCVKPVSGFFLMRRRILGLRKLTWTSSSAVGPMYGRDGASRTFLDDLVGTPRVVETFGDHRTDA